MKMISKEEKKSSAIVGIKHMLKQFDTSELKSIIRILFPVVFIIELEMLITYLLLYKSMTNVVPKEFMFEGQNMWMIGLLAIHCVFLVGLKRDLLKFKTAVLMSVIVIICTFGAAIKTFDNPWNYEKFEIELIAYWKSHFKTGYITIPGVPGVSDAAGYKVDIEKIETLLKDKSIKPSIDKFCYEPYITKKTLEVISIFITSIINCILLRKLSLIFKMKKMPKKNI